MSEDNESLLDSAEAVTGTDDATSEDNATQTYDWVLDKYRADGRSEDDASMEQSKAYKELSSKFGGFTGSPDEETGYEISLPEGVEGEFYEDSPMLDNFKQIAMEANMSQDTFTKLLHSYIGNDVAMGKTDTESELSQLGANASKRLSGIADWGKANMSEDEYSDMLTITSTAAGIRAVEAMIAKKVSLNKEKNLAGSASAPPIENKKRKKKGK